MKEELVKLFSTGKYKFGIREAKKRLFNSEAKLVLVSNNIPILMRKELENLSKIRNVPLIELKMDSVELGKYLGRSHAVGVITVIDLGTADVKRIKNGDN